MKNIFENSDFIPKVKLQRNSNVSFLKPFIVNSQVNSSLKYIIDAFNSSDSVEVGYTTIQKDGKIEKPSLKKKTIWLTGNSLRSHLSNETFFNYTCVTNASPDEIKMILSKSENDFQEIKPTGEIGSIEKYANLPEDIQNKFSFSISKVDQENNEMEITVNIHGTKIFISTLNKNIKFKLNNNKFREFTASIVEDAKGRDFSVNAIYLKLKNSDGENSDISDPVGGIHDISHKQIKLLHAPVMTYKANPSLIITTCELSSKYNKDKKINAELLSSIRSIVDDVKDDFKLFNKTFKNAINKESTPLFGFLNNMYISKMFNKMFPDLKVSIPHIGLPRYYDFIVGYLLHENDKNKLTEALEQNGFNKFEIREVLFVVDLTKWTKTEDENSLKDILNHQNDQSINKIYNYLKVFGKDLIFKNLAKKYLEV